MPKNNVTDLITDQEMNFARLVLSGTMTDRDAAHAAGLNPDTAAYTKAKPRVHAYMLEYRAAMQQQLLEQEAERQRRKEQRREQVLERLWEIAKMAPEMTRGSIAGQVKAISMIVAMEGLIPDRRNGATENKPAPPPSYPNRYPAQEEAEPGIAATETTPRPNESAVANHLSSAETTPSAPQAPAYFHAPDTITPVAEHR